MTPSGADVRTPNEAERQDVIDVMRVSLNFPEPWAERRGALLPIEDFRCAYEGGVVTATAAGHRFRQWFGGRPMRMSGVYGVATLPEHRAAGLASAAVEQVLREAREGGVPLSALYPAVLRPYRKMGFELAGTFNEHRIPLNTVQADLGEDPTEVETADVGGDLEGIKACFRRWVEPHTGTIEPENDDWWTKRILAPPLKGQGRTVVVRGPDEAVEGFASFRYEDAAGPLDVGFGLSCAAFVAPTGAALRALLAYFRGFRGLGKWVEWAGPPNDAVSMLVPEQSVEASFRFTWMLRLLDVPAAFAQRGYPPVEAEAVVSVSDPMFAENAGPWRIVVRGGVAEVTPEPSARPDPIPIGALSAMFSGYLRPHDAVRLGYLAADDPAVSALSRLLEGPDPWCPFFF